ncbi:hypothetical protein CWI88_08625 [Enterobacter cancerogenus]|nr:hypothetical protein CWI88_08625 [Enterobacter cancerogenus]
MCACNVHKKATGDANGLGVVIRNGFEPLIQKIQVGSAILQLITAPRLAQVNRHLVHLIIVKLEKSIYRVMNVSTSYITIRNKKAFFHYVPTRIHMRLYG